MNNIKFINKIVCFIGSLDFIQNLILMQLNMMNNNFIELYN